jgi:hypothetical protein
MTKKKYRAIVAPRRHIVAAKHTSISQALQSMECHSPHCVIKWHSEGYYVWAYNGENYCLEE